jgi:hypothetical protein
MLADLTAALDYALTPRLAPRGLHPICGMLTLYAVLQVVLACQTISDYIKTMKTLIFVAMLLLSACTLPQVIYVQQPSDAAFWNMPVTQRWVTDPQPVKIPRWCVDPISRTNIPC